jgi:hypothetical protein
MIGLKGWARCVMAASSCGVLALLAGCTGSGGAAAVPASAASPASSSRAGSASAPAASPVTTAPLTGLAVTDAVARRPAVAVAVTGSDPVGLGSADLVFAEMTSPARYLAVFQSQEASRVGPVTSTMPTDGQALSVLHPLVGYDGGTSAFISVLDATKIIDVGYAGHASLYSAAPGGVTVSTATLAAAGRSAGPPPGLFSYGEAGASLASVQETHPASVRVDVPGQPAEQWDFDTRADRWVQTTGGPQVSVANLVVQIVPFKTVYLSHRYGRTTRVPRLLGTGQAMVFSAATAGTSGGTAADGTWSKPGLAAITNYFDAAHTSMNLEPGPTWIVLAPSGTRISQAGG